MTNTVARFTRHLRTNYIQKVSTISKIRCVDRRHLVEHTPQDLVAYSVGLK